jgi:hypothetical protein
VSEAGTGIGASELVDCPVLAVRAAVSVLPAADDDGCRALEIVAAAAAGPAEKAQVAAQAMRIRRRRTEPRVTMGVGGERAAVCGSQRPPGAKIQGMTAKELLIQEAPRWTEHDAEVALRAVEHEREDPTIAAFRDAPEDDEPLTAEEEATLEQSHEEYRRGEGVPLDEIRHEFS